MLFFIHQRIDFFWEGRGGLSETCNSSEISCKVPLHPRAAFMCFIMTVLWCRPQPSCVTFPFSSDVCFPPLLPQTTLHNSPPRLLTLATSCDHTANHQERLTWTLKSWAREQTRKHIQKQLCLRKKKKKELSLLMLWKNIYSHQTSPF